MQLKTLEENNTKLERLSDQLYAAVDLGSNSFHLVVSRYQNGEFVVIDRHKETVRLASGLNEEDELSSIVDARAINCLRQFNQLLLDVPTNNIRAVGTNAMRRMAKSAEFIERAEEALGAPIEIIAGREEARLIYLGVIKGADFGDANRIVVDIGGGSTEIIVGRDEEPLRRESLEMGCVVVSNQFFADGKLNSDAFDKAVLHCELIIQPIVKLFKEQGWRFSIGCSGTIRAISSMLDAMGWANGEITLSALNKLRNHAEKAVDLEDLDLPGLNSDRKPVFGGGLSVLLAVFKLLNIERMRVSDRALRDGVLHDLVGREANHDTRDVAVKGVLKRCNVDVTHAEYVERTVMTLYQNVSSRWDIDQMAFKKMLSWSALLHEVGMLISHDNYHKHGAYMLLNADMIGFARRDQMLLAALVRGHRRKFPRASFESLPSALVTPAKRLAVLLRLAILLHRTRTIRLPENWSAKAEGAKISLNFPEGWLESHPLTVADLLQERKWLSAIGIELSYS